MKGHETVNVVHEKCWLNWPLFAYKCVWGARRERREVMPLTQGERKRARSPMGPHWNHVQPISYSWSLVPTKTLWCERTLNSTLGRHEVIPALMAVRRNLIPFLTTRPCVWQKRLACLRFKDSVASADSVGGGKMWKINYSELKAATLCFSMCLATVPHPTRSYTHYSKGSFTACFISESQFFCIPPFYTSLI